MAHKTWTVELQQGRPGDPNSIFFTPRRVTHTIELDHNYWTTRRIIRVDGQSLESSQIKSAAMYGKGSDDLFELDGHLCMIHITTNGITYQYDLAVDQRSVQTGESLPPPPDIGHRSPLWVWLFYLGVMVAVLAGYLLALVVAHPSTKSPTSVHMVPLVLGALATINKTAKDPNYPLNTRLLWCMGIVLGVAAVSFVISLIVLVLFSG
jgi:hypothetical protein